MISLNKTACFNVKLKNNNKIVCQTLRAVVGLHPDICRVKIPPIRMRVASTPLVDSANSFDCSKLQYMAFTQYQSYQNIW